MWSQAQGVFSLRCVAVTSRGATLALRKPLGPVGGAGLPDNQEGLTCSSPADTCGQAEAADGRFFISGSGIAVLANTADPAVALKAPGTAVAGAGDGAGPTTRATGACESSAATCGQAGAGARGFSGKLFSTEKFSGSSLGLQPWVGCGCLDGAVFGWDPSWADSSELGAEGGGIEILSIAFKIAGASRTINFSMAEIGVGVESAVWTGGGIGPEGSSCPPTGPGSENFCVSTDTIALGTSTGTPKGEGDASRSEGDASSSEGEASRSEGDASRSEGNASGGGILVPSGW